MRKTIVYLLFVYLPFPAICQEEENSIKYTNQIAVNATFFFKQFLNFSSSNSIAVSPYVITYKLISPKNHAFRMGIGGNFSNKKENFNNGTPPRITNTESVDFSAGYEYRLPLTKKWLCLFGVDAVTHLENAKTVAEDVTEKITTVTTNNNYGAGPVMGIQFNISKRISLFTETALFVRASSAKIETTFMNSPQFNSKQTTSETTINFVVPASLFLAINL